MAAVLAGTKRAFHQMRDGESRPASSTASSTPQAGHSPTPRSSRDSSRPPDPYTSAVDDGPSTSTLPRIKTFEAAASIVLIGFRGVGKSSLGVIAATAYDRRLIETEKVFFDKTGTSPTNFRRQHGAQKCQRQQNKILECLLKDHGKGAVIVCGFSDVEGDGATILRDYGRSRPVVLINRDVEGIRSYLHVWTTEKVRALLRASNHLLRTCSNCEFFNLSDDGVSGMGVRKPDVQKAVSKNGQPDAGSPLTLKRVERDFLRTLHNIIGDHDRTPSFRSAYPLSYSSFESREHTFVVTINAADVLNGAIDFSKALVGADCVELVLTEESNESRGMWHNIDHAFSLVRRSSILPILLTLRKGPEVGTADPNSWIQGLKHCLRLCSEMCTIDLNNEDGEVVELAFHKGNVTLVGAYEFDVRPSDGWNNAICLQAYKRAAAFGYDLVKITMPAGSVEDAFEAHNFRQKISSLGMASGLIAFDVGHKGRLSQCLNPILTAVIPPSQASPPRINDKGCELGLSAKSATEALFSSFIMDPLTFYVSGSDVSYSLTPGMQKAAFASCGMPHNFVAHSSDDIDEFRNLCRAPDFGGSALASPNKTRALAIVDGLSDHAKAIGAINTVIPVRELRSDGSIPDELSIMAHTNRQGSIKALYGTNTDWIGIRATIRRSLSPANTVRPVSTALVCGAGGMARAAIYAMISLGVRNIFVCNRTLTHAQALATYYNDLIKTGNTSQLSSQNAAYTHVHVIESFSSPWPAGVRPPTIVVCCIPHEAPGTGASIDFELPEDWLRSSTGGVVVEWAYKWLLSPLKRQIHRIADKGWIFCDGLDVLPEQAFTQFELFTGRSAPRELMREAVYKMHAEVYGNLGSETQPG